MPNCLSCGEQINASNQSEEHIIPNALGGTLTSTELICKECNSSFGFDCDASLASDLKLFSNFLNIKRDRGANQPVIGHTPTTKYKIQPGGKPEVVKPTIQIDETTQGKAIHIEARDMGQVQQILKGLKRNYPDIDVEKTLSQAQQGRRYLNEFVKLQFVFSGKDSLRAVAKMAYFFLKHKHPTVQGDFSRLVAFIKNESDYREIYFYYPATDIVNKSSNAILHSVAIKSYPSERLLLAFVELYSTLSFIVVLSFNFTDTFQANYVFDVLNRTEVPNPSLTLPVIDIGELNTLFDNKPPFFAEVTKRFESFLKTALDQQAELHRAEMIQQAMQNSLLKHSEGVPITQEMIDEFINALMEELTPLLVRNLKETNE